MYIHIYVCVIISVSRVFAIYNYRSTAFYLIIYLFVSKDFMNSPDSNKKILEYFIRGRKIGVCSSMIYITQSFTGMGSIGKSLRANVSLWMIKRVNSTAVIEELVHQFKFGKTKDELLAMYNYCNGESPNNMLLINIEAEKPSEIFRKNLYEFLE